MDRNFDIGNPTATLPVALHKESVDRNDVIRPAIDVFLAVALHKESVDRNSLIFNFGRLHNVALHKESVDRNGCFGSAGTYSSESLSTRRAWIEIIHSKHS